MGKSWRFIDGHFTFHGDTPNSDLMVIPARIDRGDGWNDFVIDALALPQAHATAPSLTTFRGNIQALAFIGTGVNIKETWCSVHVLHDYKMGTNLYPHIHWSHIIAAPTGNVNWQLEYSVSKGHSVGTFPSTTTLSLVQAAGPQYTHQIIETSDANAIPSVNIEPDSLIMFRIFRDPADPLDTFEDDAYLLQIDVHYQRDGFFTNEKVSPFTKKYF